MGTVSSLSGTIEIYPTPRASDFDIEKLKSTKGVGWGYECITVVFDKVSIFETEDDGTEVTRVQVVGADIQACNSGGHRHYHTVETLQAIVDMLGRDRQYNGFFEFADEHATQKRYAIVRGIAREYLPTITWPDEVED